MGIRVWFDWAVMRWRAQLIDGLRRYSLGLFANEGDARTAADAAQIT